MISDSKAVTYGSTRGNRVENGVFSLINANGTPRVVTAGDKMDELQSILLRVWREACRHIEIGQSTETIASSLLRWLPLAHRLDSTHRPGAVGT